MKNVILTSSLMQRDIATAYDPTHRSWSTAEPVGPSLVEVPELEGTLLLSEQALMEATGDFGHLLKHRPSVVLRPRSAEDIVQMVRFARRHGLKVTPRGQGHTLYGQSQVEPGISIDMRSLCRIHSIQEDRAEVDAGILWRTLVEQTLSQGKTPPVLPDFVGLTVGGTLALGGLSGVSFRHGLQVDNVYALQVVTGEGHLVTCSPSQHRDLFEATLAGLGQCAIIVRATIRLVPAPTHVRIYNLPYADLGALLRDQTRAADDDRFDYLGGVTIPGPDGSWNHLLQVRVFHTQPARVDDAELLEGFSYQRDASAQLTFVDMPYRDWVNRLEPEMEELQRLGLYGCPHPWSDLFVPASKIESFASEVLAQTPPREITQHFPVLFYVFKRDRHSRPLFRFPDESTFYLFSILRTVTPDTRTAAEMLAENRALYERVRSWGGTHYAHAALDMSPADWEAHYGAAVWKDFSAAKRRYDPDGVLTPGVHIFSAPPKR